MLHVPVLTQGLQLFNRVEGIHINLRSGDGRCSGSCTLGFPPQHSTCTCPLARRWKAS